MTAPHGPSPQELPGRSVVDRDGQKVGPVQQVYLDDATGEPEWITVRTGTFGAKETFVPLAGARLTPDRVQVPYTRAAIHAAPRPEAGGHLDPGEEEDLYRHYDVNVSPSATAGRSPLRTAGMPRTDGAAGRTAGAPAPPAGAPPAGRAREAEGPHPGAVRRRGR
ncbi:PRC-barrel domain-containing protein [Streptomyces zingiberis]|uniref:PRC-barrel domain containing protein n=1 Tax=Streptomyces zingiberis TaxID=2053010 RepID=A0ABX1BRG9_9ACTN|nr:PRC-barrel domain-containing protein [Streptomyces zingiberis]NJQ00330.1 PRC-barrel domain containing protein [Streptomyces zingiberis]